MDPLTLIAGGATLLGSIFGSETSAQNNERNIEMQRETNQMSIAENQKNRDFQTQMSNTAYQRSSADMKAAGLNPMMMFGSGSAASTPSGGTPSLTAPRGDVNAGFANIGDKIGQVVQSAVAAKTYEKMTQEVANLQTQQALTAATTRTESEKPSNIAAQTATEIARRGLVRAQTETERERPESVRAERFNVQTTTAREQNRMPAYRLEGVNAQDLLDVPDWLRRSMNIGQKAGDTVAPLLNSAGKVRSLFKDRYYY